MFTKKALLALLRDEEGLTTVEYAIAGGLVGAGVIGAFGLLGDEVFRVIDDDLPGGLSDRHQLIPLLDREVAAASAAVTPLQAKARHVATLEQFLGDTALSIALLVLVALAVRQDLAERRIANVLTLAGLACGVALAGACWRRRRIPELRSRARALACCVSFRCISPRAWAPATSS